MRTEKTKYTCPDCGGAVEKLVDGRAVQYRCRIGHLYSPLAAITTHHDREENTLWLAAVVLEEGAEMAEEVAGLEAGDGSERLAKLGAAKRALAARVKELASQFPDKRM